MGQQYGPVARVSLIAGVAVALLMSSSASLAVTAGSQSAARPESGAVVDAAEAERRGFLAMKINQAQAMQWFEQAAQAGRPAAQWMLGQHYFDAKGEARDVARGLQLIRAAAEQGLAPAQTFMGWLFWQGADVKSDPEQAFAWLSAAARQEDAHALRMLSGFYRRGLVVKQDPGMAQRLLLRAAELGDSFAAVSSYVGLMYGPAESRDPPRAMHFVTKAAQANDVRAAYALAREYLRGIAVPRDPAAAVQWLQRSADGGYVLASLWLSELHFKGVGVAQNHAKAEQMLSEALTRATLQDKNQFAWELSVNEDERMRDGLLAVRVLEPALTSVAEKVTAYVDTLAAAYAEIKQFDKAVVTQLSAIDRAKRERRPPAFIDGMVARLKLYEGRKPYRESHP
jgi:TPR repeat protein